MTYRVVHGAWICHKAMVSNLKDGRVTAVTLASDYARAIWHVRNGFLQSAIPNML